MTSTRSALTVAVLCMLGGGLLAAQVSPPWRRRSLQRIL